jgi:hypothetical protein
MTKCLVTLNIARLGRPYVGDAVAVADEIARDDGDYWTTTTPVRVELSNSPLATVLLDRLSAYRFRLPDGSSEVRLVPDAPAADYSDLKVLSRTAGEPPVLALVPSVYLETDAVEPPGMAIGDYLLVDNQYSPLHGDLYQKTN